MPKKPTKPPTTQRQQRANRENAKNSTGPKTKTGKANSARNALKHGLLAQDVVVNTPLAVERQSDFDALLADLVEDLQPRGMIEETLVERIATCYWRLRRAQRYEARAIRESLETPNPNDQPPNHRELSTLRRKLEDAQSNLDLERRLHHLLDTPADKRTAQDSAELEIAITEFARANGLLAAGYHGPDLRQKVREILPNVVARLQRRVIDLHEAQENAQHTAAFTPIPEKPLFATTHGDALLRVVRYETMLDRQIHRALVELRRTRNARHLSDKRRENLRDKPRDKPPETKNRSCETNPI